MPSCWYKNLGASRSNCCPLLQHLMWHPRGGASLQLLQVVIDSVPQSNDVLHQVCTCSFLMLLTGPSRGSICFIKFIVQHDEALTSHPLSKSQISSAQGASTEMKGLRSKLRLQQLLYYSSRKKVSPHPCLVLPRSAHQEKKSKGREGISHVTGNHNLFPFEIATSIQSTSWAD